MKKQDFIRHILFLKQIWRTFINRIEVQGLIWNPMEVLLKEKLNHVDISLLITILEKWTLVIKLYDLKFYLLLFLFHRFRKFWNCTLDAPGLQ